jgi:hypothetical protein
MKHFSSRLIAAVLALCLVAAMAPVIGTAASAAWDGTAASRYSGGTGTVNDPYIITTAAELALFRDQVNSGKSSICAKVVNDIDLNNVPWTPIGIKETETHGDGYNGTFDGGGWAIKNLNISSFSAPILFEVTYGYSYRECLGGLFGLVGKNGTVQYVNIDGIVTGNLSYSSDDSLTGIEIGAVAGANLGVIEECSSTCNFSNLTITNNGNMGIGGVVGFTERTATIKNCYYVGNMTMTLKSTGGIYRTNQYVGGLIGYAYSDCQVSNCYSAAKINITSNSSSQLYGAIAGYASANSIFSDCYYDSQIAARTPYAVGSTHFGDYDYDQDGCSGLYTSSMKSSWMPATLGDAYQYDTEKVNDGYPILAVMTHGETAKEDSWYTDEMAESGLDQATIDKLVPTSLWNKDLTKNVTRAEFAGVAVSLYEMLSGKTAEPIAENPFTDTSNLDVLKAYHLGVTNGISETEFAPYSYISRQDMATMLTRVYKKLYIEDWTLATDSQFKLSFTQPSLFKDHELIASYAVEPVYFMAAQGILKGTDGYFRPYAATTGANVGYATREQAIITSIRYYSANNS